MYPSSFIYSFIYPSSFIFSLLVYRYFIIHLSSFIRSFLIYLFLPHLFSLSSFIIAIYPSSFIFCYHFIPCLFFPRLSFPPHLYFIYLFLFIYLLSSFTFFPRLPLTLLTSLLLYVSTLTRVTSKTTHKQTHRTLPTCLNPAPEDHLPTCSRLINAAVTQSR